MCVYRDVGKGSAAGKWQYGGDGDDDEREES